MPTDEIWENLKGDDGALPECQYYISIVEPDCGKPAEWAVSIENNAGKYVVNLCTAHKVQHDEARRRIAERNRIFAEQRAKRKQRIK